MVIPKRTCLPVCGLIRHIAWLQIPSTRRKHSVPWYQHLEGSDDKTEKVHQRRVEEDRRSILRNPGVVTVGKLSKEELCENLTQNVVYREGPLVAINKPQGLPISGDAEVSLVSLLPDLQRLLQIKPELHVVKTAPKDCSGLVLLSTCHVTTKHLEDFYSLSRKAKKPFTTFWAIALGVPDPAEGNVRGALKEEQIQDIRPVVPVKDPSKGSVERREVKETHTVYEVLDSAEGCSLLQLQPLTVFRDQLLVHCTLKFCPVLGDHTYSSRVAKTFGHDIYIPFDVALPQTQRVEEKILRKMHFTTQQMHRMPLHLHLHQLSMPSDPPGRYPTRLQAPPPPFFRRTMELLGLRMQD
ncbi:PREDICTED: RNA pseudouridylate synthase domain-containing protein 3 [Nanorana parkeri]|uniref:RNA pseudouridylate synthase domain-containing protein 3 n=1 Tax=Nanorana parkeri TaxID=125878 RepID=UPI0008546BF5|nr:PREDICTED: RNA pseudouridylate synthase domain-containing protein 3 [Nanorana parkeri]